MKRVLFVLLIGFVFYYQAEAKKMPGYYITKSGDTVRVVFDIPIRFFLGVPNYLKIQLGVEYYVQNNETLMLHPPEAREISFSYLDVKSRMISCEGNAIITPEFAFLHLIKDGKLRLFKYYTKEKAYSPGAMAGGGGSYDVIEENYIFQKDSGAFFQTKPAKSPFKKNPFRDDMMNYLSDCPYLVKKIEKRDYVRDDIEKIVDIYNAILK